MEVKEDIILKAEHISKQYRLGLVGTGTINHDLNRWWHRVRGKEDPYLKIGSVNDRSTKADSDYVWALQDINFEVKCGEVLGIIGKNGAGKSTLLKILSRVTSPTTGEIKTKGRIASLLEVGTGFHPELTGRENIYLNGAILGMTKAEIKAKETEIIEFSGCERYVDTPVKRYSSGMRVRLAFAVAAHLEPDILVVDEVLAVGDAEFQKKAVGKMQDISKGDGRTVLFVSHNMLTIQELCSRVIVLENGKVSINGETFDAVREYLKNHDSNLIGFKENLIKNDDVHVKSIALLSNDKQATSFSYDEEITVKITYSLSTHFENMVFLVRINDENGNVVFTSWDSDSNISRDEELHKTYTMTCAIPSNLLKKGLYSLSFGLNIPKKESVCFFEDLLQFEIDTFKYFINDNRRGIVLPKLKWTKTLS